MEKTQNYIENPLGTKPIKKLLTSFAWPAITANIIDTKNFRSLLTGAVPTAVTTNILYLISMKTLLTIILITPYSSKFDNASLTMKLYARWTINTARKAIGNTNTHLSVGLRLLTRRKS